MFFLVGVNSFFLILILAILQMLLESPYHKRRRRRRLERYPLQVRHKQDWSRGFILLLPQTVALPESDAGSGVIKPASSFVIQNRQTSCSISARCIGHAVRTDGRCFQVSKISFLVSKLLYLRIEHAVPMNSTWSAVGSEAPHSQFGEGAIPYLCMDEWNRPTPVRRQLSLTQAARGKPIPTGLAPVSGTKTRSLEAFSQYSTFHL